MNIEYEIINATAEEEKTVILIVKYIYENYSDKINVHKLRIVEIVDSLGGSSARTIRNKIFLARDNGIDGAKVINNVEEEIITNEKLEILLGTMYHELWHVSTWDKYEEIYEPVINISDLFISYGYMYWIEYIANSETVFMDNHRIMIEFCDNFVTKRWDKIEYGYSDFIKALPYYLNYSHQLNIYMMN